MARKHKGGNQRSPAEELFPILGMMLIIATFDVVPSLTTCQRYQVGREREQLAQIKSDNLLSPVTFFIWIFSRNIELRISSVLEQIKQQRKTFLTEPSGESQSLNKSCLSKAEFCFYQIFILRARQSVGQWDQ